MLKITLFLISLLIFSLTNYAGDYFVVADPVVRGLIKVNAETGDREKITGSWFSEPSSIVCDSDGNYYAVDYMLKYVLKLNDNTTSLLSSGTVSGMPRGDGDWYFFPFVLELYNNYLYVYSKEISALFKIDITTGDRFYLSGKSRGSGPTFTGIMDIVYINGYFYIVGYLSDEEYYVYKVDTVTGDRVVISSNSIGTGPGIHIPMKICSDNSNNILIVSDWEIMRINTITGNREIVSGGQYSRQPKGLGPEYSELRAIAFDNDGFIYVADVDIDCIFKVNPDTGDREIVWESPLEQFSPVDMIINKDGNFAVLDAYWETIIEINRSDWSYKMIESVYLNKGEKISYAEAIALKNNDIYLGDESVLRYNINTGVITLVSGNETHSGPIITGFYAIDVNNDNNPVIYGADYMLLINSITGEREVITGNSDSLYPKGNGPEPNSVGTLIADIDGNYIIGPVWKYFIGLGRVDSDTGNRTIISSYGLGIGNGPSLGGVHMKLDEENDYVGIVDKEYYDGIGKIYRDTGNREIILDNAGNDLNGFCFDSEGNYIVTDIYLLCVAKIDKTTKQKTILSQVDRDTLIGYGWAFQDPCSIVLLPKMLYVKNELWEIYE